MERGKTSPRTDYQRTRRRTKITFKNNCFIFNKYKILTSLCKGGRYNNFLMLEREITFKGGLGQLLINDIEVLHLGLKEGGNYIIYFS